MAGRNGKDRRKTVSRKACAIRRGGQAYDPQLQGSQFEKRFRNFLEDLIPTIGWTWVDIPRIRQSGRCQGGRDIDCSWRDGNGARFYWRFECKSHKGPRPVPKEEVHGKILETVNDYDTHIDCWCVVAPFTECDDAVMDQIDKCNRNPVAPCYFESWTKTKNSISCVIQCFPKHHRTLYGKQAPRLTSAETANRLASLRETIEACCQQGSARRERATKLVNAKALRGKIPALRRSLEPEEHKRLGVLKSLRLKGAVELAEDAYKTLAEELERGGRLKGSLGLIFYIDWGLCADELGRDSQLAERFRKAYECSPLSADGLAALSVSYYAEGNLDGALEAAEAALKRNSRHPRALRLKARVLSEKGKLKPALQLLAPHLSAYPECAVESGKLCLSHSEPREAVRFFETAVQKAPGVVERAWLALARMEAVYSGEKGRLVWQISADEKAILEDAIGHLSVSILELQNTGNRKVCWVALLGRARHHAHSGNWEAALDDASKIPVEAGPVYLEALAFIGGVCIELGRYVQACKSFAVLEERGHVKPRRELLHALALIENKEHLAASHLLDKHYGSEDCGNWPAEVLELKAHCAAALDDYENYCVYLSILDSMAEVDAVACITLALMAANAGCVATETAYIDQAMGIVKKSGRRMDRLLLALRLAKHDRHTEALPIFRELLTPFAPLQFLRAFVNALFAAKAFDECLNLCVRIREFHGPIKGIADVEAYIQAQRLGNVAEAALIHHALSAKYPTVVTFKLRALLYDFRAKGGSEQLLADLEQAGQQSDNAHDLLAVAQVLMITGSAPCKYVDYAYRALLANPDDPNIAMGYIGIMLSEAASTDSSLDDAVVKNESTVRYRLGAGEHEVRIAPHSSPDGVELGSTTSLGCELLGMRKGDEKTIEIEGHKVPLTVLGIRSKYVVAFQETMKSWKDKFRNNPALRSFNYTGKAEDFDPLFRSIDARDKHVKGVLAKHKETPLPLPVLSQLLGRDEYEVWQGLTGDRTLGIACPSGRDSEMECCRKALAEKNGVVMDFSAALTIVLLEIEDAVAAAFGTIYVTQSLVDEIDAIVYKRAVRGDGVPRTLVKAGDKYAAIEGTRDQVASQDAFVERIRQFVRTRCTVVPLGVTLNSEQQHWAEVLGETLVNATHIAREKGCSLLTDDVSALSLAANSSGTGGFGVATAIEMIPGTSSDKETRYKAKLLENNYKCARITDKNLRVAYEMDGLSYGKTLALFLDRIAGTDISWASAVNVMRGFLLDVWSSSLESAQRHFVLDACLRALFSERGMQPVLSLERALAQPRLIAVPAMADIVDNIKKWRQVHLLR